ncbi:NAD(P)/FAD-dependent oxidoreductase [Nonomuraea sp. NPDC002799]
MRDAIVIGGGPAGLSAALMLGRAHRSVLLLDAGEPRNAAAEAVHNLLGLEGTPPAELRRIGREALKPYKSVDIQDGPVTTVARSSTGAFTVHGRESRRLLLATGLADELPDISGVRALWGRAAFHCPYCHGYELTGSRVAVIGASPDRVRLALHLSRFTPGVTLCGDGARPAEADRALLAARAIPVRCEPITRLEGKERRLDQIVFEGGPPEPARAVFVRTTLSQRSPIAGDLGCALLPDGLVEVDDFGRTSVPGVWAAGDMARRASVPMPFAAVIAAAASGTIAAGALDQDLLAADFGLAGLVRP